MGQVQADGSVCSTEATQGQGLALLQAAQLQQQAHQRAQLRACMQLRRQSLTTIICCCANIERESRPGKCRHPSCSSRLISALSCVPVCSSDVRA